MAFLGADLQSGLPIGINDKERRSGLYILGKPGMGKTSLLVNLILQDLSVEHGLFFLDPHGDAVIDIIKRMDNRKIFRTAYVLDPSADTSAFGINILGCDDINSRKARQETATKARWCFERLWNKDPERGWGVWLEKIIRYIIPVFIENQEYTVAEIPLFLLDQAFRDHLLRNMRYNQHVTDFWEYEFPDARREQRELIQPALTRIETLIADEDVRHIVGQRETTLNFRRIMQEEEALFLTFSSATLAPDIKEFIGTIVISELLHTVLTRTEDRIQFCIFVDEFQHFATSDDFRVLITEARKFGVATTLGHQERFGQFGDNKALLGATAAAGNKVFFQLTPNDARELSSEFAEQVEDNAVWRGGELMLSSHVIEDIWDKGHPERHVMSEIRPRYFWLVDLLRTNSQQQYFQFDPARVFYSKEWFVHPFRPDWSTFGDIEMYRSSRDMIKEGINLLNSYYLDGMRMKIAKPKPVTDNEVELMCRVIHCFGGVLGWRPSMVASVTEAGAHTLINRLRQSGAAAYEPQIRALQHFGATLNTWGKLEQNIQESRKVGVEQLMIKLGFDPDGIEHKTRQVTNCWFPAQLRELKRILLEHGMVSAHEFDTMFEWTLAPQYPSADALLKEKIIYDLKSHRGIISEDNEYHQHIMKKYIEVMTMQYFDHAFDDVAKLPNDMLKKYMGASYDRVSWQLNEISIFVMVCFSLLGNILDDQPLQVQSGHYDEMMKRERSQTDLIVEKAQELVNLPRFTAYAKVLSEENGSQAVLKRKIQTFPMPPAPEGEVGKNLAQFKLGLGIQHAINKGILRPRSEIESEIRQRRDKWRASRKPHGSGGGGQPPTTWS